MTVAQHVTYSARTKDSKPSTGTGERKWYKLIGVYTCIYAHTCV